MRYILFIVSFAYCVSGFSQIDPAIAPYFERFKKECTDRKVVLKQKNIVAMNFPNRYEDSIFQFDKMKPMENWAGVAVTKKETGEIWVFFNPKPWYMSDDVGRELFVFHELFHAYFSFPHIENEPLSMAISSDSAALYYYKHRKEVLDRMFEYIKLGHYE